MTEVSTPRLYGLQKLNHLWIPYRPLCDLPVLANGLRLYLYGALILYLPACVLLLSSRNYRLPRVRKE